MATCHVTDEGVQMAHFSYAGNATANMALNQTIKILKAITCQTNKTIK
jgi:hypothetical protein